MLEGCLARLAALVASKPFLCGAQTFGVAARALQEQDLSVHKKKMLQSNDEVCMQGFMFGYTCML